MNFLQKLYTWYQLTSKTKLLGIAIIATLVFIIPLTVFVSSQRQDIRQRASGAYPCDRGGGQPNIGDAVGSCDAGNGCTGTKYAEYRYATDDDGDGVADPSNQYDQVWCEDSGCTNPIVCPTAVPPTDTPVPTINPGDCSGNISVNCGTWPNYTVSMNWSINGGYGCNAYYRDNNGDHNVSSSCSGNNSFTINGAHGDTVSYELYASNGYQGGNCYNRRVANVNQPCPQPTSTPAPTQVPNCTSNIICGQCVPNANTCGPNNGTKSNCNYTGPGTCRQVAAPNQTCDGGNNCGSNVCVNNTCVAPTGIPTSTPFPTSTPLPTNPQATNTPNPTNCTIPKNQGNADDNCLVDIQDFNIWRDEFIAGSGTRADFNGNGVTDLIDFNIWRNNAYSLQ